MVHYAASTMVTPPSAWCIYTVSYVRNIVEPQKSTTHHKPLKR